MFGKKKEKYSDEVIIEALIEKSSKAEKLINNKSKMDKFLVKLEKKLRRVPKVGKKLADIPVAIALIKAYVGKNYQQIPMSSIIGIVSALIYFFAPIDMLPDALPIVGYLDDATTLSFLFKMVNDDLDKFKVWRGENIIEE